MGSPRLAKRITFGTAFAGLALAGAGLLPLPSQAQQLFCCQLQGKKVCGDRLPDQCVGKPHTVRGPGGTVRQVDGMLTPEQRNQKEAEEKRKVAEKEAQAEQRRKDNALLATYMSERDIDAARQRAETDVQTAIKQAEEKIATAESGAASWTPRRSSTRARKCRRAWRAARRTRTTRSASSAN